MKETGPVKVHHVTIVRSAQSTGVINMAKCRLCGAVIEHQAGPLQIKEPGLYAVRTDGPKGMYSWRVPEPLQSGMEMCLSAPSNY